MTPADLDLMRASEGHGYEPPSPRKVATFWALNTVALVLAFGIGAGCAVMWGW